MDNYYYIARDIVRQILNQGTLYETDAYPDAPVKSIVYSDGLAGVVVADGDNGQKFISYDAIVTAPDIEPGSIVGSRLYLYPNNEYLSVAPFDDDDWTSFCVAIRLPNRLGSDVPVIKFISLGCNAEVEQKQDVKSPVPDAVSQALQNSMVSYEPKAGTNKPATHKPATHNTKGWDYVGKACPDCGGELVYRVNSNNNTKFIGCQNWARGCRFSCATDKLEEILNPPAGPKLVDDDLPF